MVAIPLGRRTRRPTRVRDACWRCVRDAPQFIQFLLQCQLRDYLEGATSRRLLWIEQGFSPDRDYTVRIDSRDLGNARRRLR